MVYTLVKTTLWAKLPLLHPLLGQFSQCNLWCLLEYSVVQNLVPRRKNVQSTLEIKELTSVKLSDQKEAKWSGFTQPVMWKCCHCSLEAYSAVEGREWKEITGSQTCREGPCLGREEGSGLELPHFWATWSIPLILFTNVPILGDETMHLGSSFPYIVFPMTNFGKKIVIWTNFTSW